MLFLFFSLVIIFVFHLIQFLAVSHSSALNQKPDRSSLAVQLMQLMQTSIEASCFLSWQETRKALWWSVGSERQQFTFKVQQLFKPSYFFETRPVRNICRSCKPHGVCQKKPRNKSFFKPHRHWHATMTWQLKGTLKNKIMSLFTHTHDVQNKVNLVILLIC